MDWLSHPQGDVLVGTALVVGAELIQGTPVAAPCAAHTCQTPGDIIIIVIIIIAMMIVSLLRIVVIIRYLTVSSG